MAYSGRQMCYAGIKSGANLSAAGNQYKFVKWDSTDRTIVLCAGVTDIPCGVLQNTPNTGEEAEVCYLGETKVQGDADLAVGDEIGTSADGQAAKYTVADTTKRLVGTVILGNSAAAGLATAVVCCIGVRANIA